MSNKNRHCYGPLSFSTQKSAETFRVPFVIYKVISLSFVGHYMEEVKGRLTELQAELHDLHLSPSIINQIKEEVVCGTARGRREM